MMKILDYYFLALLRAVVGRLEYQAPGIMGLTFAMNLFSLADTFVRNYVDWRYLYWGSFAIGFVLYIILAIIYNDKRIDKIIDRYADESLKSRQRGIFWVITYEILSLVYVIFAINR